MPQHPTAGQRTVVDVTAVLTGGAQFDAEWAEDGLLLLTPARQPGQIAASTGVRLLMDVETAEGLLGTLSEALTPAAPVAKLRAIPGGA